MKEHIFSRTAEDSPEQKEKLQKIEDGVNKLLADVYGDKTEFALIFVAERMPEDEPDHNAAVCQACPGHLMDFASGLSQLAIQIQLGMLPEQKSGGVSGAFEKIFGGLKEHQA